MEQIKCISFFRSQLATGQCLVPLPQYQHTRGYSIMRGCIGYPEQPGEYKLSTWALSDEEILEELPILNDMGIFLYHCGNFGGASDVYRKALDFLEQMSLKERPHTTEWNTLQEIKVPLQLNYAQCKFCLCEYDKVVALTTSVLEFEQDNARALFQRAEAHLSMYNLVQARRDYERVIMLNLTLAGATESQLTELKKVVKAFLKDQKRRLIKQLRIQRSMAQLYN